MKKILYLLLISIPYIADCQSVTYNASLHTVTNKAIGYGQATPGDARSMYYD